MSKPVETEFTDAPSNSVIIKDDVNLDTTSTQTDNEEIDNYDLEIQQPAERAKIINNKSFFKKLSYRFYSETARSSKTLAAFQKHYHSDYVLQQFNVPSKKSGSLTQAALNNLNISKTSESSHNTRIEEHQQQPPSQQAPKSFKIKTIQPLNIQLETSASKRQLQSPPRVERTFVQPRKIIKRPDISIRIATEPAEHESMRSSETFNTIAKINRLLRLPAQTTAKSKDQSFVSDLNVSNCENVTIRKQSTLSNLQRNISPTRAKLLFLAPFKQKASVSTNRTQNPSKTIRNENSFVYRDKTTKMTQLQVTSRNFPKK